MTRKPKRHSGVLFLLLMMVAGASAFWVWQRFGSFADAPLTGIEAGESVVIERGDSLPAVLRKLREAGISDGKVLEWRVLARQLGADGRLQVGEYALQPGTTARQLLKAMRDGKVVQRRFTIVEGWNIRELRAALAAATPLEQDAANLDDGALMKALGHAGKHPEGRFLPETYQYTRGDSDIDLLKRANAAMDKALAAAWAKRQPGTVLKTPDEMLVLASIVEKETGIAAERPQIAGLFLQRLKIGMRLQTDPTVIYGIGAEYDGNIRKRHLLADTPYNTYVRAGLPPTPIAMPGVDALDAVARPVASEFLYFVAVGDGSGRHLFARTYAEHQANVRTYLQKYRDTQSAEVETQ